MFPRHEGKENEAVVARYAYDGFGRLVREDNKPMGKTTVFSYDANGNILSKRAYIFTLKSKDGLEEMPCDEKLYAYKGDRLMSYNGEEFVYDEIGNPTTYRGRSAVWSYGRLMGIDGNIFSYDVLGRRVGKNDIDFTYDGNGNLIRQSNGLEFLYDHTGVFAVKYSGSTYFYRKNAQNDIIALLDTDGNVVVQYKYDAWGNHKVLDANGTEIADAGHIGYRNPFRYRSYYYDTETGLYFLKTRYYDPETGRFLSPDSVEYLDPETIGGLNLYTYCNNNPVMFSDPEGHMPLGLLFGALGILPLVGSIIGGVKGGINASANGTSVAAGVFGGMGYGALMGTFATGGIASLIASSSPTMSLFAPALKMVGTGLLNTAVNGMYYTFFSDGISSIVESSDSKVPSYYVTGEEGNYGYQYISRWERLDYTRSVTGDKYYGLNAFRFYGEYSFHMYAWMALGSSYKDEGSLLSGLAGSAFHANVDKIKGDIWYRNIVYFLTAILW